MAVKTFNYTNDRYIEAADTRAQIAALLRNSGYGFKGNITRVGSTNTYTVTAGSVVFIGGLCVRVLTDEAFDLTSDRYIVVETIYTGLTDGYTCTLKSVTAVDASVQGDVVKQFAIYDKTVGIINKLLNVEDNIKLVQDSLIDYIKKSKVSINYYVGKTGNDSNDGLTPASRFLTIQKAIDSLPQVINHTVNIYVSTGSYAEGVNVQGFSGMGSINIYDENGQVQVQNFTFTNCSLYLKLYGNFLITTNRIAVYRCVYTWIYGITSTFASVDQYGFIASASIVILENSAIGNKTEAISSQSGAVVYCKNVGGSGNTYAYSTSFGGQIIAIDTNTITGASNNTSGGAVKKKTAGSSIASNGYKIHDDGLIEQWMTIAISNTAANTTSTGTATFPMMFPNGALNCEISCRPLGAYDFTNLGFSLLTSSNVQYSVKNGATAQQFNLHIRVIGW